VFEAVICPECRATEGLTKVDDGTYYCPYHKGLFKRVDPHLIKVDYSFRFCSCGNTMNYRCGRCQNGLCRECDVIKAQRRLTDDQSERKKTFGRVIIAVEGFGYLELIHLTRVWKVTGNRVMTVKISKPVIGPFLSLTDIWPQIVTAGTAPRHLCCECLRAEIPQAAEAIAAGRICENPGCGSASSERCRCCKSSFCKPHFKASSHLFDHLAGVRYAGGKGYREPSTAGLCPACADESKLIAHDKIEQLLAENPLRRMFAAERRVSQMIEEFDRTPRPCDRARVFDQEASSYKENQKYGSRWNRAHDSLASRDFMISTYKVLDERDRVGPGPG
jgi:hypothetical protein